MRNMKPWSRQFAWFALITAALAILLGLFNMAANTAHLGSWLPLLLLMPWPLYLAIWSLRARSQD
ncbi:hypothetical protein [Georgenia satyanarayanai]|uniref:hypothetical protein n=1 Tax=Georgenia satyanarayanai TaxID=860221 RepID=UPI001264884C|nr:hypothetical protein [Georgenia satyanarayanai]